MTETTWYAEGDPDPTLNHSEPMCCASDDDMFSCTWPKGHDHPQHIAGGRSTVCHAWPVDPHEWCQMVPDGTDTNGEEWNRCVVHNELVLGDAYVCEGYVPPPFIDPTTKD